MDQKKLKVLVVEDDLSIVELIRFRLESVECLVDIANDGEIAMSKIFNPAVDLPELIVLDVMLPKINGYEIASKIKTTENTKSIPIIMLTARNQPLDKIIGLVNCKVDHYLTKPFDINDLIVLVLKYFNK